ncbi:MAG: HEPN domain-containing protein [Schaedlerella sp.]|uniref:HEPN domain-containing protein n=1 Tax=Schaedlerella sp. TaxID=2676057 RepID=UPI00262515D6|nr:HEPN domain-containing protein [uncultured Schaedlerella sp.]
MADRGKDLSAYRLKQAEDTLKIAEYSLKEHIYKDAVNRSYYVAFYATKAVLALGTVDFRRHKDVMAYFNKEYVAAGIFPKALGKKLGALQRLREKSDYDDFYIASKEKAEEQIVVAKEFLQAVKDYLE